MKIAKNIARETRNDKLRLITSSLQTANDTSECNFKNHGVSLSKIISSVFKSVRLNWYLRMEVNFGNPLKIPMRDSSKYLRRKYLF